VREVLLLANHRFSTPKGIPHISTYGVAEAAQCGDVFQYPEGHSSYFHQLFDDCRQPDCICFSTPKGIPHISTDAIGCIGTATEQQWFQYPEGHSSYFHYDDPCHLGARTGRFSTPKGIPHISTYAYTLHAAEAGTYSLGFSTPKGIPHISTACFAAFLIMAVAMGFSTPKGIPHIST